MRFIFLLASFLLTTFVYSQIEIQTNFTPYINKPLDDRGQIATLADTSTIAFTGAGVLTYVEDTETFYVHNGTQ
jgi:hypothetical protein